MPRPTVFLVAPGVREPEPQISVFMKAQAESLRGGLWEPRLGIVDNRSSLGGLLRNIVRLRRELTESGAGAVHALYGTMTALAAAAISGRRPLIVSFCGDDLLGTPMPGWRWRVREKAARWASLAGAFFADAIIVKSENLRDSLPEALRGRATVVPNGVDVEQFRPRSRAECRRELGWPEDQRVVLFSPSQGTNAPVKNAELAQETLALLRKTRADVRMRLLRGMTPKEVATAMNAADCLLVTSLHEGSPNVVKEALATGLPVVSTPCGDVPLRLRNVAPGAVCPYDAKALAAAVAEVLDAGRRSNGPLAIVAQRLDLHDVAQQLARIYEWTVQKRRGRARSRARGANPVSQAR